MSNRQLRNDRRGSFRKGVDVDATRQKREDLASEIRKNKREENLMKRRRDVGSVASDDALPDDIKRKIAEIPRLAEEVNSNDPQTCLNATRQFRKLLSIENLPPIELVISAGVIPRFVELLRAGDAALQFEAAWALTNIASGTSEDTITVINFGAVPVFRDLLLSPCNDVREQSVWALGNIAGDSAKCRDLVLEANCMEPLLQVLQQAYQEVGATPDKNEPSRSLSVLRNAAWTLSNFCRGRPSPLFDSVKDSLRVLCALLYCEDEEVLTDACWALSYLSEGTQEKIQHVVDHGCVRRLVELLSHPSPTVKTPALRAVGNVVTGDAQQTQVVLYCGVLNHLLGLLQSPKRNVCKEACWTISNITAGTKEQIQSVFDHNLIPPLIQLMTRPDFEVKKEATWAVCNATSGGTAEHVKYLVSQGCIKPLCDMLEAEDPKLLNVVLEAIENILRVGKSVEEQTGGQNEYATFVEEADGLNKIEHLQNHRNSNIYNKAVKIIEDYYGFDDAEEVTGSMAPAVDASDNKFMFGQPTGGADGSTMGAPFGAAASNPAAAWGQG